jgi:carnitine O-acetyltransferase
LLTLLRIGLQMLLEPGETVPEVFDDPLVQRGARWTLSTSAVFSKHFATYGWGEVVPDGFGVAYMTGFEGAFFFCCFFLSCLLTWGLQTS